MISATLSRGALSMGHVHECPGFDRAMTVGRFQGCSTGKGIAAGGRAKKSNGWGESMDRDNYDDTMLQRSRYTIIV